MNDETPDSPDSHDPSLSDPLAKTRDLAESMPIGTPQTEVAYPFHLRIEGFLTEAEKTVLLRFLLDEKIGIHPADLEVQFASGKILIPMLSEFAGIKLVGLLQFSKAKLLLFPAPPHSFE